MEHAGDGAAIRSGEFSTRVDVLLLSGWVRGEELMRRRVAAVEVRRGRGRVVLFSFTPFFRGQTRATFPLFYNAVLAEAMDPPAEREQPAPAAPAPRG